MCSVSPDWMLLIGIKFFSVLTRLLIPLIEQRSCEIAVCEGKTDTWGRKRDTFGRKRDTFWRKKRDTFGAGVAKTHLETRADMLETMMANTALPMSITMVMNTLSASVSALQRKGIKSKHERMMYTFCVV